MGFFNERCPNCGKPTHKNADFCRHCGCPKADSWCTCPRCAAALASESRFCWKCGLEQSTAARQQIYGDRWHRSPADFAIRIDLATPGKTLHHGIQIDDGTLALLFQDGRYLGSLAPGYHTFDTVIQRLLGLDQGKQAHAILIDAAAAEVDFQIENVRTVNQVPVDVRLRLLFQVADPKLFADRLLQHAPTFATADLTHAFLGDVREGMQEILAPRSPDEILCEIRTRELVEGQLVTRLEPILAACGLKVNGVRLADFAGPAIDYLRDKLGEISRLNRELELNRQLRDAAREEKVSAFRDEEQLRDYYQKVVHEMGFKAAERDEERQRFMLTSENRIEMDAMRHEYQLRRAEIQNRLDEQILRHQDALADARHQLDVNRLQFEEDLHQQKVRFAVGQEEQVTQARTDLEVAQTGLQALKQVLEVRFSERQRREKLELELEADRLKQREAVSLKALLATISGEQADRLLKMAELEMRRGLSAEQALALVAEKSPEIAPAIAQALQARYTGPSAPAPPHQAPASPPPPPPPQPEY